MLIVYGCGYGDRYLSSLPRGCLVTTPRMIVIEIQPESQIPQDVCCGSTGTGGIVVCVIIRSIMGKRGEVGEERSLYTR